MRRINAAAKPPVSDKGKSFVRGFKDFINDYGVIPLAVGVVIGSSVNDLVKTMVDGIFTPFISLISPQSKLQNGQKSILRLEIWKIRAKKSAFLLLAMSMQLEEKRFRQETKIF